MTLTDVENVTNHYLDSTMRGLSHWFS